MYEIEDVQSRIDASDISKLFTCMLQPLYDENATVAAKAYAQAAFDELDCGLLKYSKHACKTCVKQLPTVQVVRRKRPNRRFMDMLNECEEVLDDDIDDDNDDDNDNVKIESKNEDACDNIVSNAIKVPEYALVNGFFRDDCSYVVRLIRDCVLFL